jgi:hypothetical protein
MGDTSANFAVGETLTGKYLQFRNYVMVPLLFFLDPDRT